MPDEEEQLEAYSSVSHLMKGKEVIIRTLDVGGDKEVSYLKMGSEQNPFLGWRAIRYCLSEQPLFKTQLRALLRAGAQERTSRLCCRWSPACRKSAQPAVCWRNVSRS